MKMMVSLLVALMGFGSVAQAGLLLEPYAVVVATGKSGSSDLSGNALGARVGWGFLGFAVGLDAEIAGGLKSDPGSTVTPGSMGAFVAYQFPILVRGYFTYSPAFKVSGEGAESTGTSTKIGVQYTGLPFVAIGLETVSYNISKVKSGSTESDVDVNGNYTGLVFSIPFSF